MGIGALNSSFQKKGYATADMEAHWEEAQLIRKIFAVEAAMARTQGHMGIIPQEAAEAISENAVASNALIEKAQSGGVGNPSMRCGRRFRKTSAVGSISGRRLKIFWIPRGPCRSRQRLT